MKILGLLASPRKNGNTELLLDAALDAAAKAGAEVEKIDITSLELNYCIACGSCYGTGTCIYNDGAPAVHKKMMEADGIVIASPNYFQSITAQLKTVFDRFSLGVHCFLLDGKYGASVTTAGGGDDAGPAEYANACLRACGAQTVGALGARGLGIGAVADQEAVLSKAAALGADLVAAINEKRVYPDQAADHEAFADHMKQLVTFMGDKAPYQVEHWRRKGWI